MRATIARKMYIAEIGADYRVAQYVNQGKVPLTNTDVQTKKEKEKK